MMLQVVATCKMSRALESVALPVGGISLNATVSLGQPLAHALAH